MAEAVQPGTALGVSESRRGVGRVGRLSVLAAAAALVAAVLAAWLDVSVGWPIVVVGLGGAAVASVVDARRRRLPDVVVIPATAAVVVLVLAGAVIEDSGAGAWRSVGVAVLTGILFGIVCFAMPAQLGLGDAKLAVLLALPTAWLSPTVTLWAFAAGFVFAGVWAAVMLLRGRCGRAGLPLGPFLTLGAATAVLAVLAG